MAARQRYRAIVAEGEDAAQVKDAAIVLGGGHHRQHHRERPRRIRQRRGSRPARRPDRRDRPGERRAADGGAAARGQDGEGRDGGVAHGRQAVPGRASSSSWSAFRSAAAVAMENARLFAEAQQRAAELDTVNTVSRELAGKLDLSGADRARRQPDQVAVQARHRLRRACSTATPDMINFPYRPRRRQRIAAARRGLTSKIIDTGEALLLNSDVRRPRRRRWAPSASASRRARISACPSPSKAGPRA